MMFFSYFIDIDFHENLQGWEQNKVPVIKILINHQTNVTTLEWTLVGWPPGHQQKYPKTWYPIIMQNKHHS